MSGSASPRRVLVTGGVRSGKSRHAERLLSGRDVVTYVAPGAVPTADDPDWAARVAEHRARRPAHWRTLETSDLAAAIAPGHAVLVDCLGTWLTAVLDDLGAWDADPEHWRPEVDHRIDAVVAAVAGATDVVLVTNEVGLGVVPAHASGRVFRDLLGILNQRVAEVCDEVHLVVAGRALRL